MSRLVAAIFALSVQQEHGPILFSHALQLLQSRLRQQVVDQHEQRDAGCQMHLPEKSWQPASRQYRWKNDTDFLYTWSATTPSTPEGAQADAERTSRLAVNLTATEATLASGPLSLLLGLRECGAYCRDLLREVEKENRPVRLHLIGVNPALEPNMLWDEFLVGGAPAESALPPVYEKKLLTAFPFLKNYVGILKKTGVTLLFSGCCGNDPEHKHVPQKKNRQYKWGGGYDGEGEAPDLVFFGNPGFTHYPQRWSKALVKLANQKHAPLISTGYGKNSFCGGSGARGSFAERNSGKVLTAAVYKTCSSKDKGAASKTNSSKDKGAASKVDEFLDGQGRGVQGIV